MHVAHLAGHSKYLAHSRLGPAPAAGAHSGRGRRTSHQGYAGPQRWAHHQRRSQARSKSGGWPGSMAWAGTLAWDGGGPRRASKARSRRTI
jgi:hypothetical protein